MQQPVRLIRVVLAHVRGYLILYQFEVLLFLSGLVDESFFKISQCLLKVLLPTVIIVIVGKKNFTYCLETQPRLL